MVACPIRLDWQHLMGHLRFLKVTPAEAEARIAQVPLNEGGELTSIGSISHAAGDCKPCAYWLLPQQNGRTMSAQAGQPTSTKANSAR
eukprot:5376663-Amphidinium_carterae.1